MIDTSKFEYERYRERMVQGCRVGYFCKVEHFDETYFGYLINSAHRKQEVMQLPTSLSKRLFEIYESLKLGQLQTKQWLMR